MVVGNGWSLAALIVLSGCILAARGQSVTSANSLPLVLPGPRCQALGFYFDAVLQRCLGCSTIDLKAMQDTKSKSLDPGIDGVCVCSQGLVQCPAGGSCLASTSAGSGNLSSFTGTKSPFECHACPMVNGTQTAPSRDKTRCMACDPETTQGYSTEVYDCVCLPGYALVEVGLDGALLDKKQCVQCKGASSALSTSSQVSQPKSNTYDCTPCPDPIRMHRNLETGVCDQCAQGYQQAGGTCVSGSEAAQLSGNFAEANAIILKFRDLLDGVDQAQWANSPYGRGLGVATSPEETMSALRTNAGGSNSITVKSSVMQLFYMSCAVSCTNGNTTACQCLSNLCVMTLYEETAVPCEYLRSLYATKTPQTVSAGGGIAYAGMPWIFYAPQRPADTLYDRSLGWRFTLGFNPPSSGMANYLRFWLASYSLQGKFLGWQFLNGQLDLCAQLGGVSPIPRSPSMSWARFGSSLITECSVPFSTLQSCGVELVFHELFIEDTSNGLLPIPVRILNYVDRNGRRPNLNQAPGDEQNDMLVRRFTLCDSVSGREGTTAALSPFVIPTVFRWVAHAALQVTMQPNTEGQAYVPVLSLTYAEKKAVATGALDDGATGPVTFRAEYAMDTTSFWTTVTVLFVLTLLALAGLMAWRMYLFMRRYPFAPLILLGGDQGLFIPRMVVKILICISTFFSGMFWFLWVLGMYWLCMFRLQQVPHVLMPTAIQGKQYTAYDVLLIILNCVGVFVISFGLWKQLNVFFFLVDWEQPSRNVDTTILAAPGDPAQGQPSQPFGLSMPQVGSPTAAGPAQMVGAPLLAGSFPGANTANPGIGAPVAAPISVPDSGVSAWRSLFICNELNERLISTRCQGYVTWLAVVALLEGCNWKTAARWAPRSTDFLTEQACLFNPFLQFAIGACTWMMVILLQLLLQRILSVRLGHDLNDFVDLCSVSNVSVLILDEPFHGFYIHGKAPSSRGDWSHTELARVLLDEDKGIGFTRGLAPDGCQTFELFLPPDMAVQLPNGASVHFRQYLSRVFADVRVTQGIIDSRKPEKPTPNDIAQMSHHRCTMQTLVDSMVQAVSRGASEVVQIRRNTDWFWGAPPAGGVAALRHPIFYKDQDGTSWPNGLGWSSCLAYGSEIRFFGIGLPTGFEWHLALMEFLFFTLIWRFQGSIVFAGGMAFFLNWLVLQIYAAIGKMRLSHTTIINSMFLI